MLDIAQSSEKITRPTSLRLREESWLLSKIAETKRSGMFSEVLTITPGLAQLLLERNEANRKFKPNRIAEIANDIREGRYQLNGSTIVVSKDGYLNDGQNRLKAVLEAGESIQTVVVFGVERETRSSVDIGTPRSVGDMIGMGGDKYTAGAAAAARLLLLRKQGIYAPGGASNPSKVAIHDYFKDHRDEIMDAIEAVNCRFSAAVSLGAFAAAYTILRKINEHETPVFFRKLIDSSEMKKTDPRFVAHNYLSTKSLRPWEKLDVILRHWNAWRSRKPLAQAIPPQGMYPKKIES